MTVVTRGRVERQQFALTFDDGPGQGTRGLLDLLADRGAVATFFLVGREVERDPEMAQATRDAGHEVGSHSYAHLDHDAGGQPALDDVLDGAAAIERTLGVKPQLFRAPYGHFTEQTVGVAAERGWKCIGWSALGNDWEADADAELIASRILPDLQPGAIVLLHDARHGQPMDPGPMLGATQLVLDAAAERGLEPVTVSQLLR